MRAVRTLFRGAHVFDGTGAPLASADVAVEGGRIVEVGPDLDGDEALDLDGRTLLPGLFDCHTHVMLGHVDIWRIIQQPFSYRFYDAIRNLRATLDAGITTVRDAGGADLGVKRAVDEGIVSGPRIQISLRMLSQTGGHGDGWLASGDRIRLFPDYPGSPNAIVDGPHEMRRKVRELVRAGAEVIKVATSGGVLSPRDHPDQPGFDMEELEVLVAEARAAGLDVMAHAQSNLGIKNALRAGIRSIDHGIYLDDEAIQLMLDTGAYLVATLVAPVGVVEAAERGANIPEASLQKAREVIAAHQESFRAAYEAGVNIAMGTDSAVTPHGENLRELELMADCGMSAEDVLVATTRAAAELMRLEHELGTIEPGKRADLVVVDGDPFDFATLRERILAVYKDGELVSPAAAASPAAVPTG
ncbi:MAG: amidohydrolase family protein [Thermoleophilia bacterium]|nr:amidohydrolase family protein [Thermoleophilia bacterium]